MSYHQYELSNEPTYPTKNLNRVSGGKKAASHFTREELSERSQRAAGTRAMSDTQSHSGSRPPYSKPAARRYEQRQHLGEEEDEDESTGVCSLDRNSKRARSLEAG